ncbi:NAD(P)-dependent dehydrogenase, short-chain alcohol dehydrogenase family [Parafrankia irregularis]|uniref:NAD(P)-dependent dehydrogenase, short-chain alcohol dehydrogenase family n=1 Tax=Parafrankia irregularis TaxID=795642 RepID=A0A0S4QIW9_9ACTN|nr:SDR family NAD(P)-dependent oxidoreductase [Parafrankia sp. CH37]MBE3204050.1 SDR family oxidoreductase [Parafrankia sp. CH37]CUU55074.1 NAD(P)-dependent dehydrogenase, short-chain alcohol dehydrogenase family [Parafrankia irregularis]
MTTSFDLGLAGTAAVVTGAGAGIGQAIARGLAAAGVRIGLVEIDPTRAAATAELIEKEGGRAVALPANVMDTAALADAITATHAEFGRLDILVNNAGGVKASRFLDQSERSWRRHIDINLVSMLAATSTAAPLIAQTVAAGNEGARRGGGSIVNITSIEGMRAAPMYAVYAACKAGMINFTRTMALELAEAGIRINAIAPDMTATAGIRGIMRGPVDPDTLPPPPAERLPGIERYVPLGREGIAAEIADAAVFLCSDRAAYITGTTLSVDGGTAASAGWLRSGPGWTLQGAPTPSAFTPTPAPTPAPAPAPTPATGSE